MLFIYSRLPAKFVLALFTAIFIVLLFPGDCHAQLKKRSFFHNEIKRQYLVHLPKSYDKKNKTPVIIALHPGGTNGKTMIKHTGFNSLADKENFIVVYPEAYKKYWNDGRDFDGMLSQRYQIDDSGFISAIIDSMIKEYNADEKRIFVTGASNGAMLCYRLACEITPKIRAIAPVAASMPENLMHKGLPKNGISVIIILGQNDPIVPWRGGEVKFEGKVLGKCTSAQSTVKYWTLFNKCGNPPVSETLPDKDPNDGTIIVKDVYEKCNAGQKIAFYTVKGGGSGWPGGVPYLPSKVAGLTSKDMNASKEIWDFFKSLPDLDALTN